MLGSLALPAQAAWTGIAAFISDGETEWVVAGQERDVDIRGYGLRIEEKTAIDLRVGARIGQFYARLSDPGSSGFTEKYQGEFLSLYLRWPHRLSESLTLHTGLDYRFNVGQVSADDSTEIDWNELTTRIGLGYRIGLLGIQPFAEYRAADGDVNGVGVRGLIEASAHNSAGIVFDLEVDRAAYVRLSVTGGATDSLKFSLTREF